ncbi:hypothetical protein D9756_000172 [Leucocoprinus leucothites]|uniref:Uncharacterized protein n=1 Tax=Leucocoprinus leucothites TaxID=201217 RepID=A0A8H5LN98_9AGAR|nr:hypothetical protein D9756_000172 [Leucoagaricus leucothites]
MLLQQIKTWTAIRTLQSRSRIQRSYMGSLSPITPTDMSADAERVQAAESDSEGSVTWTDASGEGAAKVTKWTGDGCSITAYEIKEEENDRTRASKVAGVHVACLSYRHHIVYINHLPQPDPHPTRPFRAHKTLATNVGALMHKLAYHAPIHTAIASCLPRENMWRPCELDGQLEIPGAASLEPIELLFHNPHDMLGGFSYASYAVQSLGYSSWAEERDKDILREYFKEPSNIVLHSDCPHLAPHIVITPAEETPNDFYIPWNNRTLPQWSGFLMVPPYDLATGRLGPSYCQPAPQESNSQSSGDSTLVDEGPEKGTVVLSKRVFCHSRFHSFVEATANERLILYHVAKALQKHQCKAVAYAASARAPVFRRRYEVPEFLASIEKPFVWMDPAEPLLAGTKHMPGATVLESSCPFVAPHILISSPPPQNPWIPWHNAVNDPQDGRYLTVPSSRVNYINSGEDEGEEPEPRYATSSAASSRFFLGSGDDEEEEDDDVQIEDADYEVEDELEVDHSESPPLSRPSSPGPETPTDDTTFLRGFFSVRRPSFVIDEDDEDDRALALAIAKNAVDEYYHHSASMLRVSLPVIEEEDSPLDGVMEGFSPKPSLMQPVHLAAAVATDEDDDLPPLDGWYLGGPHNVRTRTLVSAVAVA